MSRQIMKGIIALGVLSGIVGFSFACDVSTNWEYAFASSTCSAPSAIATVNDVINAGNFYSDFLDAQRSNPSVILIPNSSLRASYDASFTGLVYNLWIAQNITTASKLASALQSTLDDMWSRYTNPALSNDERTKFAYLYYLNKKVISALKGTNDTTTDNGTSTTSQGFSFLQQYTALNGRPYTLWYDDVFFVFSRGNSNTLIIDKRSRSLQDLINLIEHQNRIVVSAPNGKRYGIRKNSGYIRVNRSNGTILSNLFDSVDEAENMLSICASNEPIAPENWRMCGFIK